LSGFCFWAKEGNANSKMSVEKIRCFIGFTCCCNLKSKR